MATNRDVQLVIKARDEASRAFEQASAALEGLLGVNNRVGTSATATGARVTELAGAFLNFDKAATKVFGAADSAAAGMARLGSQITARKGELAAIETQASAARMAIEKLSTPEAIANAGTSGLERWASQLAGAKQELERLGGVSAKLNTEIRQLEVTQQAQVSGLQQIGSTAIAAAEGRERLSQQLARETAAMREQARAASVLATVERSTGVARERGDYEQLTAQIRQNAEARDLEIRKLREQEQATAELARAQESQSRVNALLGVREDPRGNQARASMEVFAAADDAELRRHAAAMRDTAEATRQMDREVAQLRNRLNPLAQIQADLATKTERLADMHKAGAISAREYEAALELVKKEADDAARQLGQSGIDSKGRPSLFGLTPYQLTNFSYQINDVITQLASGASLTQTMAQQGGQLIQIFPRVGSAIVAALGNPLILAAAAAFGALALGINEAMTQAERLRAFEGLLRSSADGATYQAEALRGSTRQMELLGMSAEDAVSVIRTLVTEGVNPARIVEFGQAARQMSEVLGVEATDAARQLSEGLTGGYDAIVRLNEATNALTAEEMERIRVLMESGNAEDARRLAAERTFAAMREGAEQSRGPWREATMSLNTAWNTFLTTLSDSGPIEGAARLLDTLADRATNLLNRLNRLRTPAVIDEDIGRAQADLAYTESHGPQFYAQRGVTLDPAEHNRRLAEARQRIAALQQERAAVLQGTAAREADTRAAENQAATRRRNDRLAEIDDQGARDRVDSLADARRTEEAGRLAFEAEMRRSGDARIAQAERELAISRERRQIDRRNAQEAERLRREAEQRERRGGVIQEFGHPLGAAGGNPTSPYGRRAAPRRNGRIVGSANHRGDDYARGAGTPVYATGDGRITNADDRGDGYGISIRLDFGNNIEDLFGHLSRVAVQEGQRVQRGDLIGYVGSTGQSTGNHLHHGRYVGGRPVNPNSVRSAETNPGDVERDAERELVRRAAQQERFNEQVDAENERRVQSIAQAQRLLGLSGERLFAEQRRQTIEDATLAAEQAAARQNLEVTAERRAEIERTVGAEWDLANAQERATAAIDEASAERQAILERLELAYQQGAAPEVIEHLRGRLNSVNDSLRTAIDRAITFWQQFDTAEARTAITNLMNLNATLDRDPLSIRRDALQRPVDDLSTQRGLLQERIQFHEGRGEMQAAEQLETQLLAINNALNQAITNLQAFWTNVAGDPAAMAALGLTAQQLETIRMRLEATRPVAEDLSRQFLMTARQMNESLVQGAVSAIDRFAQAIGEGRNVISSLWDTFRQFAADFLRQIAQMILNQAIFNLVSGAGGNKGAGKGIMGIVGGLFHGGGVVGEGGGLRLMRPEWIDNARRYHSGGIAGLKPGEMPAVLKRGEEVLTAADPRHVRNGGGAEVHLKNVVVFDPADVLSQGLSTRVGERALMTFVHRNSAAFRSALDR